MRRTGTLGLLLWMALAAQACAAPVEDRGEAPSAIELGSGRLAFEGFDAARTVELTAGPQGGWHVYVSARVFATSLDGGLLEYEARREAEPVAIGAMRVPLDETRATWSGEAWERCGDVLVLRIASPSDVVGRELAIRVGFGGVSDSQTVLVVDEQ